MTENKLATQNQSIVMPAVNAEQALEAWAKYQDLKSKIIDRAVDIQMIGDKEFLKKSYWRKIATFFNLSLDVVSEEHEQVGKTIVWHFTCRATAPNGRSAIGTGSCDAFEKAILKDGKYVSKFWNKSINGWDYREAQANSIHNIRTTAETRAFNRAVSNLVGGGEVSAEEVVSEVIHEDAPQTPVKSNPVASATAPEKETRWCKVHAVDMIKKWSEKKQKSYYVHENEEGQYCFGNGWLERSA